MLFESSWQRLSSFKSGPTLNYLVYYSSLSLFKCLTCPGMFSNRHRRGNTHQIECQACSVGNVTDIRKHTTSSEHLLNSLVFIYLRRLLALRSRLETAEKSYKLTCKLCRFESRGLREFVRSHCEKRLECKFKLFELIRKTIGYRQRRGRANGSDLKRAMSLIFGLVASSSKNPNHGRLKSRQTNCLCLLFVKCFVSLYVF